MVANHLPQDREVILHTENGLLGMGPAPAPGEEDPDLINAGKQPVTALPGASYFHHADSFAMMRGGHLDCCVLGAFQVSVARRPRQLAYGRARTRFPPSAARWTSPSAPSSVFVMMEHQTRSGESKIVAHCTYPVTGLACVNRIYTDLAVIDVTPTGLVAIDIVPGLSFAELARLTGVPLRDGTTVADAQVKRNLTT